MECWQHRLITFINPFWEVESINLLLASNFDRPSFITERKIFPTQLNSEIGHNWMDPQHCLSLVDLQPGFYCSSCKKMLDWGEFSRTYLIRSSRTAVAFTLKSTFDISRTDQFFSVPFGDFQFIQLCPLANIQFILLGSRTSGSEIIFHRIFHYSTFFIWFIFFRNFLAEIPKIDAIFIFRSGEFFLCNDWFFSEESVG